LSWLDDSSVNNLRCNRDWLVRIDNHRNEHYWQSKLLNIWPQQYLPDTVSDYRAFYIETQYDTYQRRAAGQFLPLSLLRVYFCDQVASLATFGYSYANILSILDQLLAGVILADNVDKYKDFNTTVAILLARYLPSHALQQFVVGFCLRSRTSSGSLQWWLEYITVDAADDAN
jgi:hypothetical protein